MTFAHDMTNMTPDEIRKAVIARLRDHSGMPWSANHGEPVWGLLLSAFEYWRHDPLKLNALNDAFSELVPSAFEQANWELAKDACEFVVALASAKNKWLPPTCLEWPLKQWLADPTEPMEKTAATIPALQLLRLSGQAKSDWLARIFRVASLEVSRQGNPQPHQLKWFEECWKALLATGDLRGPKGNQFRLFDALRAIRGIKNPQIQSRTAESIVAWAWLMVTSAERKILAGVLLKTIEDFDERSYRQILLRITEQEFATIGAVKMRIADIKKLHPPPKKSDNGALRWLRSTHTPAKQKASPATTRRRSESSQLHA